MTSYDALNHLIEANALNLETAKKAIFDAYYKNRIDGYEYEELCNKAERIIKQ